MALTFQKAIHRPSIFYRLTSFTIEEFSVLCVKIMPEWNKREHERLASRPHRLRAIGQGRPYAGSFETRLLCALVYLGTACGGALLAMLFNIDEVTMRSWRHSFLPLLQDRFIPNTVVSSARKRINDLDEFLKIYPELKELIADGVELKTQRPKRKQAKNYTGKSKRHVKKIVVGINSDDGLFVSRTKIRPGSVHDKRVLDEDPLHKRLNNQQHLTKRADSAWTGEDEQRGWIVNKRGRRNHPLTEIEKKQNKKLSKIRIKVEHAIRRMKIFRRLAETVVIRTKGGLDQVINAAMNLANFKVLIRQSNQM